MKAWRIIAVFAMICAGALVTTSVIRLVSETLSAPTGSPGVLFERPWFYHERSTGSETIFKVGDAWFKGYAVNVTTEELERVAGVMLYDEDGPVVQFVNTTIPYFPDPTAMESWDVYIVVLNNGGTWYISYCDAATKWYVDALISALDSAGSSYQTWGF